MEHKEAHMCYGGGCDHPSHYAEGGNVNTNPSNNPGNSTSHTKGINKDSYGTGGLSRAGAHARATQPGRTPAQQERGKGWAKEEHKKVLSEMQSMPKPNLYAEGGSVDDDEMHPMVSRVMMSRVGMIANDDEPEADSMPAEFDDLALDDDLEGTNSGASDGDQIGDSQEDEDRHDIVSRILKSRSKKDRMPRPA